MRLAVRYVEEFPVGLYQAGQGFQHISQMAAHPVQRLAGIPVSHGIQNALMLGQQPGHVICVVQGQHPQTVQRGLFPDQQSTNAIEPGGIRKHRVKPIVKRLKRGLVAPRDGDALLRKIIVQRGKRQIAEPLRGKPFNNRDLQCLAQELRASDLVFRQLGNIGAPAWPRHNQPVVAQLGKRLSHRGAAGAEKLSDLIFRDQGSRCNAGVQDGRFQGRGNLFRRRARQVQRRYGQGRNVNDGRLLVHARPPVSVSLILPVYRYAKELTTGIPVCLSDAVSIEGSFAMADVLPKKAVLFGAGMVARTHVAACLAASGVALHGVQSRSTDRAQALADASGHPIRVYADLQSVVADPEVDFAIVLTPPNARANIIGPLAAAGKHILLEKPIGRDADEARQVVTMCRDAGVRLGIVLQHRMRAASLKAAELVAGGSLGALGLVEIAVPWWRDQAYYDEPGRGTYARDGGGVLISQAIHTIDLALSLAGPVDRVRAMATTTRFHKMEAEDFVVAGLEFSNGAAGSLVASTASYPGGAETITLHFDKVSLHLGSGQLKLRWRDGREELFGEAAGTGGGADPMAFTHEWHQGIIEDFAAALTEGRDPAVSGEAALAAHDLIDAITLSACSGHPQEVTQ